MASRRCAAISLLGVSSLFACSDAPTEAIGSTSQAIVHGTASTAAQDFTVLIVLLEGDKLTPICSGTLVAKNLVLTARHCIGDYNASNDTVVDYDPPSKLGVYAGVDAYGSVARGGLPRAVASKLFSTKKPDLMPDIALIKLGSDVIAPIAPVRLDGGAVKGEQLTIVGYGLTDSNEYPSARQQRSGLQVAAKAPDHTTYFQLLEGEFQFGEGACEGDSGGPALSAQGALVGVGTRISNGQQPSSTAPAAFCMGGTTEDVYTELAPAKSLIQSAFDDVGASPWLEGQPQPTGKAATPAKTPTSGEDSGCAFTPSRPRSAFDMVVMTLLALVLGARRRR